MQIQQPMTAYYNGACPVCRTGIGAQKELMNSCSVAWIDVHQAPDVALKLGINLETIRERLHVVDEHGKLNVGADALSALWLQTQSLRWLGAFARWPLVDVVSRLAYNLFAKLLYRWNRWMKHW